MREQKANYLRVPICRCEEERCSPQLVNSINGDAAREPLRHALHLAVACTLRLMNSKSQRSRPMRAQEGSSTFSNLTSRNSSIFSSCVIAASAIVVQLSVSRSCGLLRRSAASGGTFVRADTFFLGFGGEREADRLSPFRRHLQPPHDMTGAWKIEIVRVRLARTPSNVKKGDVLQPFLRVVLGVTVRDRHCRASRNDYPQIH